MREILKRLGVEKSTYYRWFKDEGSLFPSQAGSVYEVTPSEKDLIIAYALKYPDLSHRLLAWKMVDEDVVCVSPSSVYRLLKAENLVCRRPEGHEKRYRTDEEKATKPDERWQTDVHHIKIKGRTYYLVSFIDEYSRYVVYHELLISMDKESISLAAQTAIDKTSIKDKTVVQSDNGKSYLSRDFKMVLSQRGVGHNRIHPYCPEENGVIERWHRTLDEAYEGKEAESLFDGREVIGKIVRWYNEERLHSALNYLRPVDYYRGEPDKLLEERRRKLIQSRQRRKEKNLSIRQRELVVKDPWEGLNRKLSDTPICPIL
jgi:transposase InsO family protein